MTVSAASSGAGLAVDVSATLAHAMRNRYPASAAVSAAILSALSQSGAHERPESVSIGWAWECDPRGPRDMRTWDAVATYTGSGGGRRAARIELYKLPEHVGAWIWERTCDPDCEFEPCVSLQFTLGEPSAIYRCLGTGQGRSADGSAGRT